MVLVAAGPDLSPNTGGRPSWWDDDEIQDRLIEESKMLRAKLPWRVICERLDIPKTTFYRDRQRLIELRQARFEEAQSDYFRFVMDGHLEDLEQCARQFEE